MKNHNDDAPGGDVNRIPGKSPSSRRRGPCPQPGSGHANKLAAVILDVLAGVRVPADAAAQAGVSLPRYYQLELRALDALVRACEPRPRGKTRSPERRMDQLQRQVSRLEQECARQQALVRAAHRALGLSSPPAKPTARPGGKPSPEKSSEKSSEKSPGRRKRQRRPTARALKAAKALRAASEEPAPTQEEAAVTSAAALAVPLARRPHHYR